MQSTGTFQTATVLDSSFLYQYIQIFLKLKASK